VEGAVTARAALARLHSLADPGSRAGMERFGIRAKKTLGVCMPKLRALARECGRDHDLAARLWESGLHEARILASLVDEPDRVTEEQAEQWAADFDSWNLCDQCCMNLFRRLPFARSLAVAWSARGEEFVKRAGFALMATLAVHDAKSNDAVFEEFLALVERESTDGRNFVRKAVNWALRQIGKRSMALNERRFAQPNGSPRSTRPPRAGSPRRAPRAPRPEDHFAHTPLNHSRRMRFSDTGETFRAD
jgi:3-methyladenine DNA glycosylase AlkD